YALHRQPPLRPARPRPRLRRNGKPVPVDVGGDGPEEGKELLRDPRHRIPEWRRAELGLTGWLLGRPFARTDGGGEQGRLAAAIVKGLPSRIRRLRAAASPPSPY